MSMTRRLLLPGRRFIKLDDELYDIVKKHKWSVDSGGYAFRTLNDSETKELNLRSRFLRLNRFVYEYYNGPIKEGLTITHIDGDRLNNQIENLRTSTISDNAQSKKKRKGSTSVYKGVDRCQNKWRARIEHQGKKIYIGLYDTEMKAAEEYDRKALELFGKTADFNFPKKKEKK